MRLVLALVLSFLAAGARAQAPDTAAMVAEAERLLTAAGAQEFFVNETARQPGPLMLRHKPSGYLCIFSPGRPENRVTIYPHPRAGHNVSCSTATNAGTQTSYFTHEPDPNATEQTALEIAVAGIRQRFPDATPAVGGPPPGAEVARVAPAHWPKPLVAVFSRPKGDERVDVGRRGEWLVKVRFSAPPGTGRAGGTLDVVWRTLVIERDRWAAQAGPATASTNATAPALRATPPLPIAEQRADALRRIEASGASGKFEPVEQDGLVMYRHRASGMTCSFQPAAGKLNVGADASGGEVASCFSLDATGQRSSVLGVQPKRRRVDADQALRAVAQGLQRQDASLRPASGPGISASLGPRPGQTALPPHRSVTLEGSEGGRPVNVRVTAAVVGDWILTDISRAPVGDRVQMDLLGELGFIASLSRMVEAQKAAPAR